MAKADVPAALQGVAGFVGVVWSPTPIRPPLTLEWSSNPAPEVHLGMTPEGTLVAATVLPSGRVEGIESSFAVPWAAVAESDGISESGSQSADDVD